MANEPLKVMPREVPIPMCPVLQVAPLPMNSMPQVRLGPDPCNVTCPSCGASILTRVQMQPSMQTHFVALLLCLVCVCCTCIPYLVESCQNADHHCPNCDAYLGTFKR